MSLQLRPHVAETGPQGRLRDLKRVCIGTPPGEAGRRLQDHFLKSIGPRTILEIAQCGNFIERDFKCTNQNLRQRTQ